MIIALRILLGILLAVAAAIVVIPLLLVFDLVTGGTALGLCPSGLGTCQPGYFTGLELLGVLLVALFVAIAGIGLCAKGIRYLEERENRSTSIAL